MSAWRLLLQCLVFHFRAEEDKKGSANGVNTLVFDPHISWGMQEAVHLGA